MLLAIARVPLGAKIYSKWKHFFSNKTKTHQLHGKYVDECWL